MKGRALKWVVRGAIGAGVLIYLLGGSRWDAVTGALRALDARFWVLGVALYLCGQALCAWKWGFLAEALGMPRPYRALAAYYFGGMFFNLFLPTTVGGDLARATALSRPDGSLARAAVSVLADRGTGFVALAALTASATLFLPQVPPGLRLGAWSGLAALLLGGGLAVALPGLFRRLGETLHGALMACRQPGTLVAVLLLSFLFQGLVVGVHVLLGRALGLSLPPAIYVLAAMLPAVVAMLPISVNGVGTRDAAYVAVLALAGVPREAALAFALSWFALIVVCSVVGGVVLALLAPGQMTLLLQARKAVPAGQEGS